MADAFHTLSISPPNDQWYMDTGATSHMTSNEGNLSSYFNLGNAHKITVGNDHLIPIQGTVLSSSFLIFSLNNILHAPHLIKNLDYVRQFTIDNYASVKFDPLVFLLRIFKDEFS